VDARLPFSKICRSTGLGYFPSNTFDANAAWFEIIMAATDLIDSH
jgi:hypothetical protein